MHINMHLNRKICKFFGLTPTITGEQGLRISQMRVQHQNWPKPKRPAPANPVHGEVMGSAAIDVLNIHPEVGVSFFDTEYYISLLPF